MKVMLHTATATGLTLLLVAAVVFGGHDRSMLVPPPEAVAESFAREIASRRFDLALNFLARDAKRLETAETIAARFESSLAAAGKVNTVEGHELWMRETDAAAEATIVGDRSRCRFDVVMIRESGLWRVAGLPDLVR